MGKLVCPWDDHQLTARRTKSGRIRRARAWQVPRRLRRYRYRLGFEVNPRGRGRILVIGLNPSTASLTRRDPTVDSFCRSIAVANGFRELEIANLFALRSTDKFALLRAREVVGGQNDSQIIAAIRDADAVLLAWGAHFHKRIGARAATVERMVLRHARGRVFILARNADGSPAHPLYRTTRARLLEIPRTARRAARSLG